MSVTQINHPLIQHKVGLMRQKNVSVKLFKELVSEVAMLLTYEATRSLETEYKTIESWSSESITVEQLSGKKLTLVPILRAGLGMLDGALQVTPSARVSVVGIYRNEQTLEAVPYFDKLTSDIDQRVSLLIDPMLATGGSACSTIELLKSRGCQRIICIFLVAAPEGIAKLQKLYPEIDIYTAAIDEKLNENGYIIPGLGDAGDKIFGTK